MRKGLLKMAQKPTKNKGGRPTIMTPAVIEKLEYAFSLGCTDIEACLHADIAVQTLYKYQDREPKFLERKNALKSSPIFLARESVLKGLKDDPDLALKFLERRKKDEFSTKIENDHRVEMVKPILGGQSNKELSKSNDELPSNSSH
jgi:hypothetical protein